jgi:hypothetical protein
MRYTQFTPHSETKSSRRIKNICNACEKIELMITYMRNRGLGSFPDENRKLSQDSNGHPRTKKTHI